MTDSYSLAEEALAVVLRSLGDLYFPGGKKHDPGFQVSADDAVLSLGSDYFIIYRPGEFTFKSVAVGIKDYSWQVSVDLFVRYISYAESFRMLRAFRGSIVDLLDTHQTLGGQVQVHGVDIRSVGRPAYFRFKQLAETAKPNFIIQPTVVTIVQRVKRTTGDL